MVSRKPTEREQQTPLSSNQQPPSRQATLISQKMPIHRPAGNRVRPANWSASLPLRLLLRRRLLRWSSTTARGATNNSDHTMRYAAIDSTSGVVVHESTAIPTPVTSTTHNP